MVKEAKIFEKAAKILDKPGLLVRFEAIKEARLKSFRKDTLKYKLKTGKEISKKQPDVYDRPSISADTKIRIDLKSDQPPDIQR